MPRVTGTFERQTIDGEPVNAFIPAALPPRAPPLDLSGPCRELLERAEQGLERLDIAASCVPASGGLEHALVRMEAVASCQLDGVRATLLDLLAHEAGAPLAGAGGLAVEIWDYLGALAHCRKEMSSREGAQPSMRLLNEGHRRLMRRAHGQVQSGRLRTSLTWVGGTRPGEASYVPPPIYEVARLTGDLQTYMHHGDTLHPLVRASLVHAQFLSIHPYLDGNGRIARLLTTLLLERWRLIRAPLLSLSIFLQRHRDEYDRRLGGIRRDGDWEGWVAFFVEGVAAAAAEALATAKSFAALLAEDRDRLLRSAQASVAVLRLLDQLPHHPLVGVPLVTSLLQTTPPTAAKAVALLESLGMLEEISGRRRDRVFSYRRFVELLGESR